MLLCIDPPPLASVSRDNETRFRFLSLHRPVERSMRVPKGHHRSTKTNRPSPRRRQHTPLLWWHRIPHYQICLIWHWFLFFPGQTNVFLVLIVENYPTYTTFANDVSGSSSSKRRHNNTTTTMIIIIIYLWLNSSSFGSETRRMAFADGDDDDDNDIIMSFQ